jgi:hypothetical protein
MTLTDDEGPTNVPITIRDQTIDPGRSRRFELPVARLPSGTWESMPVAVVNGRKSSAGCSHASTPVVWPVP